MRRIGLRLQVFSAILLVVLGAVLTVGLVARNALSAAFDDYLTTLPAGAGMAGRHMGRAMLGAAEQTFIATVDRSVYIGVLVAVLVTALAAVLLARYLAKPIQTLEKAAEELAEGGLAHRVKPGGPTEVAALGDAFNRMADSLEESERLRRRLIADVAHELRNPIAAVRVHAEGMAEGVLEPDQARLDAIVRDLTRLSALVGDLQELSIAEAGGLHYEMVPLDITDLARDEAARAGALAADGVQVLYAGSAAPAFVEGDERRLSQALRNLLSNAARHTPQGTISVSVAPLPDARIEVAVTDSGEGIPEEDLPYVFERFYRADTARAADTGGAGLGLAIVRRIVEDHGGEVFARSSADEGTVVGFRLAAASQSAH